MMRPGLYTGTVMHRRLRPKRHHFTYRTLWLLLDIDAPLPRSWLLSQNRCNLLSLYNRDYIDNSTRSLRSKITELAIPAGIAPDGRILLLSTPRLLGRGFNPLNVFFCFDRAEQLCGIVWEVTNTFHEKHCYALPVQRPGGIIRQQCRKALYVSPYIAMDMEYHFRAQLGDGTIAIGITDRDDSGLLFTAAMHLEWKIFSDRNLLRGLAAMAIFPGKTILAIHWQALRLFLKGLRPEAWKKNDETIG